MKNRKGFTLVELLAVIAILAILVIIALPNVINMYTQAQKEAFLTETKKLYLESEKKYISSSISGSPVKVINSKDNSKLDITGEKLQYCVILNNNGKVTDLKVSNGRWIANLDNNKTIEDLTINDLEEGNLDDYNCKQNFSNAPKPTNCTFDGELKQGAEYVNGQYTYRYMQEGNFLGWVNISKDGWGVQLTDKTSTDAVTSKVCTYINNKPIVSYSHMFYNSQATAIDLSSFNTSKVTNMNSMFSNSKSDNIDVSIFDTGSTTDMGGMFSNIKVKELDLSSFNTSKVTNMMEMFSCNSSIENIDLSSFDTSNVTDMRRMFGGINIIGCENISFKKINIDSFNTSKVTNMRGMFSYTKNLNILNLSSFDTSKVTDMSSMFYNSGIEKIDVSNFNTSKVTDMSHMFAFTKAPILGLHNFDTSKVINMSQMFREINAKELNLSSFDTSNVTDMSSMFSESRATTLDLSNFDTSKVTNMSSMFYKCPNLKTIYASDMFSMNAVTSSSNMFTGSRNLVGGSGTTYNSSYTDDKTYARIDGGTSSPGYFTKK